ADIITPNLFELGILSGLEVRDQSTAFAAARQLLEDDRTDLEVVMVTSIPIAPAQDDDNDRIGILVVTREDAHLATTPKLDFGPLVKGTGDVIAALFLGGYLRSGRNAGKALQAAMAALYGVIEETHRQGSTELCLVAVQDKIADP
ncbi:unnamed protein product, partial [Ectocarpus sp. 12 AP-2014]